MSCACLLKLLCNPCLACAAALPVWGIPLHDAVLRMHGIMQKVELKASKVVHVGTCDNSAGNYALAKKKMTMEVRVSLMQYTKVALS